MSEYTVGEHVTYNGNTEAEAVVTMIGWDESGAPRYSLRLPGRTFGVEGSDVELRTDAVYIHNVPESHLSKTTQPPIDVQFRYGGIENPMAILELWSNGGKWAGWGYDSISEDVWLLCAKLYREDQQRYEIRVVPGYMGEIPDCFVEATTIETKRYCTREEFDTFIANYPRPEHLHHSVVTICDPPMREWTDRSIGEKPWKMVAGIHLMSAREVAGQRYEDRYWIDAEMAAEVLGDRE